MENSSENLPTYRQALLQMAAYRSIRSAVDEVLAGHKLNTTQWIILGVVSQRPAALRITDVAKIIQVKGTLITTLAGALVTAGYVEIKAHGSDRRARLLQLTPAGKKLVSEVEAELEKHLRPLSKGLSREDLAHYFSTLETFIKNSQP